ncbi:unnamed protein product [Parascedosporium putredinis]|uniref:Uncharacterized protein n=1 Tax=Parascedosporium putredinis TaxID=1442378 RepID=A0A9P1GXD1_9PEZI|nr:unnamed protein product [Parascedosporium putredinis]CAI7988912.1 unnamed protein product [Parascedosporium putredinis]
MSLKYTVLSSVLFAAQLVAGHGAIIGATGDAGGSGMALGDSTRFRGDAADTFGETLGAGDNQLEAGTQAIMAETGDILPRTFPDAAAVTATCTGTVAGQDNVCLVRCQNPARAGPFGGVVPVQMADAANNAADARRRLARALKRAVPMDSE